MKTLIRFLFPPLFRKWMEVKFRLSSLEIAVDSLIVSPSYTHSAETGFNGQTERKALFNDLFHEFAFEAILETGTHIGDTTGYMATTSGLPVYTCELTKRYYFLAKMRLRDIPNITVDLLDSRRFLMKMAHSDVSRRFVFVYLDAHWYDDLPLQQELELVCSNWRDFLIMIDDFAVPGDPGYGYDDYGRKKKLSLRVFRPTFLGLDLIPYFPAVPSAQESGARRGCVIVSRRGRISERLDTLKSLRKVNG